MKRLVPKFILFTILQLFYLPISYVKAETFFLESPHALIPETSLSGRIQIRYNSSISSQIEKLNEIELERGRIELDGKWIDTKFLYYINIDIDTDDNYEAVAHDYWLEYALDPSLSLFIGKAFVPGSREWIDGSTTTRFSDRSMATSFFRPDRSLGIWVKGKLYGISIRAMLANSFDTFDISDSALNSDPVYAATVSKDIVGSYGKGRSDIESTRNLALRVGSSFTHALYDIENNSNTGTSVQLSDATVLNSVASHYDLLLYAFDCGLKYRGFSFNAETYLRQLKNIKHLNNIDTFGETDYGLTFNSGYFIIPSSIELAIQLSEIFGERENSSEQGIALNYFPSKNYRERVTLDILRIHNNVVSSSGPDYRSGDDGVLLRLLWQKSF